jgi:hypothetical protein
LFGQTDGSLRRAVFRKGAFGLSHSENGIHCSVHIQTRLRVFTVKFPSTLREFPVELCSKSRKRTSPGCCCTTNVRISFGSRRMLSRGLWNECVHRGIGGSDQSRED